MTNIYYPDVSAVDGDLSARVAEWPWPKDRPLSDIPEVLHDWSVPLSGDLPLRPWYVLAQLSFTPSVTAVAMPDTHDEAMALVGLLRFLPEIYGCAVAEPVIRPKRKVRWRFEVLWDSAAKERFWGVSEVEMDYWVRTGRTKGAKYDQT